jgi:MFS family permease
MMLAILILAYVCSGVDRLAVTLLMDPIRKHFAATDAQMGMLQGLAFLLVYSLMGVPAGWLIDRVRRTTLIALAIVGWSIMTCLCGLAPSFLLLFLGRSGVAIGESVLTPGTYSLVCDRFEAREQGFAIGLYQAAGGLGAGLALAMGGAVIQMLNRAGTVALPVIGLRAPWQVTFLLLGLPGLVVAFLVLLLREPGRERRVPPSSGLSPDSLRPFYAENRSYLFSHHLATGMTGLAFNATLTWIAPFVMRGFGMSAAQAGATAGIAIITGSIGLLIGGIASDRLREQGRARRLLICIIAVVPGAPVAIALAFAGSATAAVFLLAGVVLCAGVPFGAATAALQEMTPKAGRGTVSAIYLLVFSIISSMGPISVGALSDHIGLGNAMGLVLTTAFLIAVPAYGAAIMFSNRSRAGRVGVSATT